MVLIGIFPSTGRYESVKHKILLLNTGYSLHSLMRANPNLCQQFLLLGLDFGNEVMVSDRQQLISQISQSVRDSKFILILDNAPVLRAREILAQGFNKPLRQDPKATQDMRAAGNISQLQSAMIPQDAIPLSDPSCKEAGFLLHFTSTNIAVLPAEAKTMLRLLANQLFPLLLKTFYPGSITVDIPIRSDRQEDVSDYIDRIRNRSADFLPLLGGTSSSPVLRLIVTCDSEKRSRQCCDSFLEDLVSECGKITTISGIGRKGLRAVEKQMQKEDLSDLNFSSGTVPASSGPQRISRSASIYASSATQNQEPTVAVPSYQSASSYLYQGDLDDDFEDDDFEDDFEEEDIPKKSRWKKRKEKSSKNKWEQDFSEEIGGEAVARKRSPIISFLLFIFILIFLGSVGYLGYYYWKSAQNRSTYQSLREVYDNPGFLAPAGYPSGYDKDFAGLWEINPDIVGWINIDGTGLDYPVVQTTDNTKYYRMNFEGEYSEHAVPFVDAAVDLKKPSTNTIIYGHNIRTDGQMFNILKGYKELEYYQQHPVVEFNSVYHEGQYKIISVFYTNTHSEHGEIFPYHEFIDSQSETQTQEYIDDVLIRSIINTGVDVLPSDELLTLSTCTYEFKDARYVVVARKVRKGESADVDTSQASMNPNPLYPDVWYQLFGGTKPDEAQLKANLHS